MSLSARQLLKRSSGELDALFGASPAGAIPVGEATGAAIAAPGTIWARLFACFARWFLWQGKVFDPTVRGLRNRISPFSFTGIRADVYTGKSWFDDRDCIVIDYSKTSFVARFVRDTSSLVTYCPGCAG